MNSRALGGPAALLGGGGEDADGHGRAGAGAAGREGGGSYAVAGLVAGTYSVALALTSPLLGLVDQVGQTRVHNRLRGGQRRRLRLLWPPPARPLAGGPGRAGRPRRGGDPAGQGVHAGALVPPLGDGGRLQAAFAVESTVQELIFVIGPPLVAVLAAVLSPAAAVLGTAAAGRGGGVRRSTPASRAWRPERQTGDWAGALRGQHPACWPPSCCWPAPSARST